MLPVICKIVCGIVRRKFPQVIYSRPITYENAIGKMQDIIFVKIYYNKFQELA